MATKIEARLLDEAGLAAWEEFVGRAREGRLFHTAAWAAALAAPFGKRARILGVFRGGELAGGCPLFERSALGLATSNPPLLAGYAGALLDLPDYGRSGRGVSEVLQLGQALEEALRARLPFVRIVHDPTLTDPRPFLWGGWRVTPRFTYRVALGDLEALLAGYEHNARKQIRKAGDAGVTVRRSDSAEELAAAYEAAYRRHGSSAPVPRAALVGLIRAGLAAGWARLFVACDASGRPSAFRAVLVDRRRAYDWIAGSDPASLGSGAVSLLVHHVFSELAAECDDFDFMGANTPSIERFKRAFGGSLVGYWETEHARGPARALLALRRAVSLGRRR